MNGEKLLIQDSDGCLLSLRLGMRMPGRSEHSRKQVFGEIYMSGYGEDHGAVISQWLNLISACPLSSSVEIKIFTKVCVWCVCLPIFFRVG